MVLLGMGAALPARAANDSKIKNEAEIKAFLQNLPNSCQQDFSTSLEVPAGKRGFVKLGDDSHFHFEDGSRARFWGINVSSTRLDLPPEQIEQVVAAFARAGLNMVRLEAIDNRNCLLGKMDAPDSLHFDAHYLDCLDHWMDTLRRHGLYYYLDLLDFRTFKANDGVLGSENFDRGARPYALFDKYLIQLQKDYATKLLTHRNPYSGLRLVDDPALALVEICNEHGFFLYPEKLEKMAEPYATSLMTRWNTWLFNRYGTRERVEAEWAAGDGKPVLRPDEDLSRQSIDLPMLAVPPDAGARAQSAPRRTPARMRDGVEFLTQVQREYFREIRQHLRSIGLKVPVTGVVSAGIAPDVASVAQECDFTSENWYGESDGLDGRWPDLRFFDNRNPLRDDSGWGFAPATASLRWNNKPVVLREWGTSWPNAYRAASVPQALAYASLQDFDALLLFGYQTNIDVHGDPPDQLNDLAFEADPTVWGMYALAGQAFLKGAIKPAANTVTLVYTPNHRYEWPNHTGDLYRLAWSVRVNNVMADNLTGPNPLIAANNSGDLQPMRALLDKLGRGGAPLNTQLSSQFWRSDTGELQLFGHEGRLEIRTPTFCAVAGELEPNRVYELGDVRFSTPSHIGAMLALSLDGQPLARSRHIIVKMVTRAENKGQVCERAPNGAPCTYVLRNPGCAPIQTFGRASAPPVRLWLNTPGGGNAGTPLMTLNMENGTWEVEIKDGKAKLVCDTPQITGLLGTAFVTGEKPLELSARPLDVGVRMP